MHEAPATCDVHVYIYMDKCRGVMNNTNYVYWLRTRRVKAASLSLLSRRAAFISIGAWFPMPFIIKIIERNSLVSII